MQALIQTVFPCYAEADRETAAELAAFLERGADVRVFLDDGCLRGGEDLAAKAREARMADTVLVLFSRHSLPPRWPRAQWEDALVKEPAEEGVRIGFLRLDDCAPPRVLEPRFDLSEFPLAGMRGVKRWVRRAPVAQRSEPRSADHELDLELLGIALADRAGAQTAASLDLALDFADVFGRDFDAVLRLDCAGRSRAALAGDLAAQLDLHLEGDLESNLQRLRDFCVVRRLLVILTGTGQDGAPGELVFGGRCSTLIIEAAADAPLSELHAAQKLLAEADGTGDWEELSRQARLGGRLTRNAGRLAECFELMQQWHALAELRDDRRVLDEAAREIVWILEAWGRGDEAAQLDYRRVQEWGDQMGLPF